MKTSKNSPLLVPVKVTSCRCQLMRPSLHQFAKSRSFEAQSNSSHLCYCVAAIEHVLSPGLDDTFKLGEILRNSILCNVFHYISNVVEVSPLSVKRRRLRSLCHVLLWVMVEDFFMLFGLLSVFRSGSDLKIKLRKDVGNWSSSVELLWALIKEFLK